MPRPRRNSSSPSSRTRSDAGRFHPEDRLWRPRGEAASGSSPPSAIAVDLSDRYEDYHWLSGVITKHYHGDDTDVKVLMAGISAGPFAGQSVEPTSAAAGAFIRGGTHPTLGRRFHACGYVPMIELLGYLEANGFTNYIASGGDRDFMRPITEEIYNIPSERVIGSSNALRYLEDDHGGTITYAAEPDVFDDGPVKPIRIWSRIPTGRRSRSSAGSEERNTVRVADAAERRLRDPRLNGDIPLLRYDRRRGAARPRRAEDRVPARRRRPGVRLHERRRQRPAEPDTNPGRHESGLVWSPATKP